MEIGSDWPSPLLNKNRFKTKGIAYAFFLSVIQVNLDNMPSKTGATTTQYSVIRESTTSRGASIVTAFTLLVLISLDPFTVASDSYKAQRRRTAVDKDQQGCLPYSDAPIILVDPVWVQDDDDDMYRFSCADGAFLVGAEPAVIQLSYSRRSVATGASFIQSIK